MKRRKNVTRSPRFTREGLTLREELFCTYFFEGFEGESRGNASEAYCRAYGIAFPPVPKWVHQAACHLMKAPHIAKRLQMLISKTEEAAAHSIDHAMREAGRIMEEAILDREWAAAGQMVKLRAQLAGHLIERRRDETPNGVRDLSDADLVRLALEASQQLGWRVQLPPRVEKLVEALPEREPDKAP